MPGRLPRTRWRPQRGRARGPQGASVVEGNMQNWRGKAWDRYTSYTIPQALKDATPRPNLHVTLYDEPLKPDAIAIHFFDF